MAGTSKQVRAGQQGCGSQKAVGKATKDRSFSRGITQKAKARAGCGGKVARKVRGSGSWVGWWGELRSPASRKGCDSDGGRPRPKPSPIGHFPLCAPKQPAPYFSREGTTKDPACVTAPRDRIDS